MDTRLLYSDIQCTVYSNASQGSKIGKNVYMCTRKGYHWLIIRQSQSLHLVGLWTYTCSWSTCHRNITDLIVFWCVQAMTVDNTWSCLHQMANTTMKWTNMAGNHYWRRKGYRNDSSVRDGKSVTIHACTLRLAFPATPFLVVWNQYLWDKLYQLPTE